MEWNSEFACHQIEDGQEVMGGAVASSIAFSGGEDAVESFHVSVGEAVFPVGQDSFQVAENHAGSRAHGPKDQGWRRFRHVPHPVAPVDEGFPSPACVGFRVNLLQDQAHLIGLDGAIDRDLLEERKASLHLEQKQAEENLASLSDEKRGSPDSLETFVELAGTAWLSYEMGNPEEKRQIVKIVTSNRSATGKNVELEPANPFRAIKNRSTVSSCDPTKPRMEHLKNRDC